MFEGIKMKYNIPHFGDNFKKNNWHTDWTGHEDWYDRINGAATYALLKLMQEQEPDLYPSLDVLWELSPETAKEF